MQAVVFSSDRVYEVIINEANRITIGEVRDIYGSPEAILLIESVPMQEPRPTSMGWLLYPSRGFRFGFYCTNSQGNTCSAIQRSMPVVQAIYHVPMTIGEWFSQNEPVSGYTYILQPWIGFAP